MAERHELNVGDRVRLTGWRTRRPDAQGTVVETDRYADRGALFLVHFENDVRRWQHCHRLVPFGEPRALDAMQAAELRADSDARMAVASERSDAR